MKPYQSHQLTMHREQLPRIRLRVTTNAGLNILCTAQRTWSIAEWLPHLQQAFQEVSQEQEMEDESHKRMLKVIKIKKGDFYVANSETVGDIFEDNDQVVCEFTLPHLNNPPNKRSKKTNKKKTQPTPVIEEQVGEQKQQRQEEPPKEEPKEEKEAKSIPTKKVKLDKTQNVKPSQPERPHKSRTRNNKSKEQKESKGTKQAKPTLPPSPAPKFSLDQIDLSRLRSLIAPNKKK